MKIVDHFSRKSKKHRVAKQENKYYTVLKKISSLVSLFFHAELPFAQNQIKLFVEFFIYYFLLRFYSFVYANRMIIKI